MRVDGAHALVTGASKGIGAAIARHLTAAGATVTLVARSAELLAPLAVELGGHHLVADLTDDGAVAGLVARAEAVAGRPVDILVNNAGVEIAALLEDIDEDEIARVVALDLVVPLRLTRQALPGMIARDRGHVVQISSAAGVVANAGLSVYNGAKAGLTHASRALRQELKGTEVGLTIATLGPVDTDMWDRVGANPPFARVLDRLRALRLVATADPEVVAADVVAAIEHGERHIRHPKRSIPLYVLPETPSRLIELVSTGLTPRSAR